MITDLDIAGKECDAAKRPTGYRVHWWDYDVNPEIAAILVEVL